MGSGDVGLASALSASEAGAQRVMLIDKCPEEWAGGNTYFTAGAYRTAHAGLKDLLPIICNVTPEQAERIDLAPYTAQDLMADLDKVCMGRVDPALAKALVEDSKSTIKWLAGRGIRLQLSFNRQAYEVDGGLKF